MSRSNGPTVGCAMRKVPVNDVCAHDVPIRADGQVMRPMYLLQVKPAKDEHGSWDLLKVVATIPGKDAFEPAAESKCKLLRMQAP